MVVSLECFLPRVGHTVFRGGSGNRKLQKERMHVRSNVVPAVLIASVFIVLKADGEKNIDLYMQRT